MSKTFYRQCRLVRKVPEGTCHQTSYIPEPFSVKDKVLKLKNSDGEWENGWVVESAGTRRYSNDDMRDPHEEIKGHRKMTGDAAPKQKK